MVYDLCVQCMCIAQATYMCCVSVDNICAVFLCTMFVRDVHIFISFDVLSRLWEINMQLSN